MKRVEQSASLRRRLLASLERRCVTATPQAVSAMIESIARSNWEYLGDTDTLLVGLLYSGSYTIDILADAGANVAKLRGSAALSVREGIVEREEVDVIEYFLNRLTFIDQSAANGQLIETADFLRAAAAPRLEPEHKWDFPAHLRTDRIGKTELQRELDNSVGQLIAELVSRLRIDRFSDDLIHRRHPVTEDEDHRLDVELGHDFRGMTLAQLDFCIAALNAWFVHKRILTDPCDVCLSTLAWFGNMPFGSRLISESEGNTKSIDVGLQHAARLSPERDLAGLVLLHQDGRIHVGQYTYRNSVFVDTKSVSGFPFRPVSVQAIRPVSLLLESTLSEFEMLVSKPAIHEIELQRFLVAHPELLQAMGYANVHPHLCLSAEESNELIPDFLLEIPGARGFDILDLKLPQASLLARSPYLRMSSELVKAIAQLRKYAGFFDLPDNRKLFHQRYGLAAFRPQLAVVIGRSSQFSTPMERKEIEEQLQQVKLLTYDDLIAYGRTRTVVLPKT